MLKITKLKLVNFLFWFFENVEPCKSHLKNRCDFYNFILKLFEGLEVEELLDYCS